MSKERSLVIPGACSKQFPEPDFARELMQGTGDWLAIWLWPKSSMRCAERQSVAIVPLACSQTNS